MAEAKRYVVGNSSQQSFRSCLYWSFRWYLFLAARYPPHARKKIKLLELAYVGSVA